MAVAIIAIISSIFALLEIALGPLTSLGKTLIGASPLARPCAEIAHAVAASDAFGAKWASPPSWKLSRVLMLVFAAIIIAVWWDQKPFRNTDGR